MAWTSSLYRLRGCRPDTTRILPSWERGDRTDSERRQKTKFKMLKVCEIEGEMQTKGFKSVCQLSGSASRNTRNPTQICIETHRKVAQWKAATKDNYRENGIFGLLVLNKWYVFNHSFQPVTQRFSWLFTYETFGPARKHGFLKKIKIQCRFLKSIFTVQSLKLVIQYFVLLVEFIYYIIRFCRYL